MHFRLAEDRLRSRLIKLHRSGRTQTEIAKRARVSQSFVSEWLRGHRSTTAEILDRLTDAAAKLGG